MSDLSEVRAELSDATTGGLRDRLDALANFRDSLPDATTLHERHYIANALIPYTDAVLHELAKREQGADYVPYPHPVGEGPMEKLRRDA